jgi:ABC-type transport system involved in Fe-S cluster assembly fused permease/ATPase subunit
MLSNQRFAVAFATTVFVAGVFVGSAFQSWSVARAQGQRVYELRTYTPAEGKLQDLHKRFRDHTLRIFKKHGMENVIYLAPQDAPLKDSTLIYIISHANRDQAKKNWAEFGADPEWQKVAAESGIGRIKIDSVYADPTDYSPMK